jgi:N-acyl homoserine lactone hydrolase
MQLSTTTIPLAAGQTLLMSSGCYLVQTSDKKNVLIDSGLPADYTPPPGTPPSDHKMNVLVHLADLGLHPDDISLLICSHFDVDHAGYHDAFPKAELIVQREHYELARNGHARFAAARPHWDEPTLRYRLVDGDTQLLPGLTQTGPVLLAIDAVVQQRLFTPDRRAWPDDDNEEQLRASTRKLLDLVEREHIALVIFGHDGQQWQTLKKAPLYYE